MKISSTAFVHHESIPSKYTCDGNKYLSPPLTFKDVPEKARSLVLIMEDPDVPKQVREDCLFVHWVLFNIPASARGIEEGKNQGVSGANTRGEAKYTGPCPPSEYEPSEHRYVFTLYALETLLELPEGATKADIVSFIKGHVIEKAELVARYKKVN